MVRGWGRAGWRGCGSDLARTLRPTVGLSARHIPAHRPTVCQHHRARGLGRICPFGGTRRGRELSNCAVFGTVGKRGQQTKLRGARRRNTNARQRSYRRGGSRKAARTREVGTGSSPNAPTAPRFGRRECGWPKISNGRRTAWARRVEPVRERSARLRRSCARTAWGRRTPRRVGYSMTSSARARSDCGTVRPSAFAVFRLMTNSNLVGCWTGRSAGLTPFRIFPA